MPQPLSLPSPFRALAAHCAHLGFSEASTFALRLAEDLENDRATVLVCGEFKRGKTSLVNALIDRPDLLPVDIRPTTAVIHVIRSGEPGLRIHLREGGIESHPLDPAILQRFSSAEVGGSTDPDRVEFIEITLRHALLDAGLVLVDTPGTNDLSRTRSEIVHGMIPRADAVIFVLDATSQITRTEATFLRDRLLATLAPPMCFVLGKVDRIEADEREEALEAAREVVSGLLPTGFTMVPASTADAVIGIGPVAGFLRGFLAGGERRAAADTKRQRMLRVLKDLVLRAIAERERLVQARSDDLRQALDRARNDRATLAGRLQSFRSYLQANGPGQLVPMIQRSFDHHREELVRRLVAEARSHGNPAVYANQQFPLHIEAAFKSWLERKVVELTHFTTRYQRAMLHEYQRAFGDREVVDLRPGTDLGVAVGQSSIRINASGAAVEDPEGQGMMIRAGLPAAGALIALTVASGGAALIVGSLVGGILGQHFAKQKVEAARESLASQIPAILQQHGDAFIGQVVEAVERFLEAFAAQLVALAETEATSREARIAEALTLANGAEADRAAAGKRLACLRAEVERIGP